MTPAHVLHRAAQAGGLTLTRAEADALAPHADLLHDLRLVTPDSRIEPGGRLALAVLGVGLLSQLADVEESSDESSSPAPGM